jgi:hypothetical protein
VIGLYFALGMRANGGQTARLFPTHTRLQGRLRRSVLKIVWSVQARPRYQQLEQCLSFISANKLLEDEILTSFDNLEELGLLSHYERPAFDPRVTHRGRLSLSTAYATRIDLALRENGLRYRLRKARIAFARLTRELDLDCGSPSTAPQPPALRSNRRS